MIRISLLTLVLTTIICCDLSSQILPKVDSLINNSDSIEVYVNQYSISHKQASMVTSFAGESDVLKLIQTMPGVSAVNCKTNEISIHGFAPQNKMILVDGVMMYYPSHISNSSTIFQSDIISSTRLFSNSYPASYGGRLFSVVDIALKEGDKQNLKTFAELTPLTAKLTVETPIIKNKLSVILSTRYNYSSFIGDNWSLYNSTFVSNSFDNSNIFKNIGFNDIYGKLSFDLNDKNKMTYFINNSNDCIELPNSGSIKLTTQVQKFQWNRIVNEQVRLNNSLSYSNHSYSINDISDYSTTVTNGLSEIALKSDH